MLAVQFTFIAAVLALPFQDPAQPPEPRSIATTDGAIVHFVVDRKATTLYTLSDKNTVACWSLTKNAEVWHTAGSKLPDMALGLGTKYVYLGGRMAQVGSREIADGKEGPGILAAPPPVKGLAYAADAKDRWVWVGMDNGNLKRIVPQDIQTYSQRALANGGCASLAIDSAGNLLAVGGTDTSIRFVGASSANVDDKKIFEGHKAPVTALLFPASSTTLLSGAEDGGLKLWNVATGKVKSEFEGHTGAVRALASDAKGNRAASGDATGTVCLWDLGTGKLITAFQGKSAITALAFLEKDKSLAASDGGPSLTVWVLPK